MIKFEKTEVVGWEAAIRGMRNPMNSWEKSDSCTEGEVFYCSDYCDGLLNGDKCKGQDGSGLCIGPNDMDLMTKLRNAGTDHRKFMRMIIVYVDITAPLYWWKEFDTYKVGTVANSCSTMHKIADKEFTIDDFSHEHLINADQCDHSESTWYGQMPLAGGLTLDSLQLLKMTINMLNAYRQEYIHTTTEVDRSGRQLSDECCAKIRKELWWQMIQLLPSSYNQKRTVMMSYEVLANIWKSRKDHKQDEWCTHKTVEAMETGGVMVGRKPYFGFCDWIQTLPYSYLITGGNMEESKK
jgi:hypothetical protein